MPVIKSAQKKYKQDKKRTIRNRKTKQSYKSAVKQAKQKTSKSAIQTAHSEIDIAVKRKVIHKNKANRLKKQVSKHAKGKPTAQTRS